MKPAKLVLASGNKGKLNEITAMLRPLGFDLQPQSDWDVPEVVEVASTFVENALTKARNAAWHTGLAALADDSGLVVPALSGEPGIYSARYAGEGGDDRSNVNKLLETLQQQSGKDRHAYFYCAMVLVRTDDDPAPLIATSRWHGQILMTPAGDGGFGYDPVFGVDDLKCSAAELDPEQKQQLSHRGQALRSLVKQLSDQGETC